MTRFAALVAILALAGCSSLSVQPGQTQQQLDFASDDVTAALVALDLPDVLEPAGDGPVVVFNLGGVVERAVLVRSEAGELAASLPPPGNGRVYHLFAFSPADGPLIGRARQAAEAGMLGITLEPVVCINAPADAARLRYSVLVALPGRSGLAPLSIAQPIAGVPPPCKGHSG